MGQGRFRRLLVMPCAALLLILAACGNGNSATNSAIGTSPLLVGVIAPFTGADASLGPAYYAACLPAALTINNNGGIMGHHASCEQDDTRGEPADAVPAARKMVATHSNLMAAVGCTSDEASSVAPIIDASHIPMFCMTGQSEFNKTPLKYFHRLVPPDQFDAYAMVGNALYQNHWTKIALVFGNDIGSQAFVSPAKTAIEKLGGTVTISQAIALGQSSYRTEVAQMLATHPEVILTEALGTPPADATYMAEVKQQNGGKMIPFIGTAATVDPVFFAGLKNAIGLQVLLDNYQAVDIGTTFSGPGYDEFLTQLNASASQFADAPKYKQRASTLHLYDGIILTALAMNATKSITPTDYNAKIKEIGNGVSGATVVHTYKEGVDAINAGKSIRFVGAGGPTNFNQYNNSQQGYILVKYDAQGGEVTVGTLTQAQTDKIIQAGGG
jgi:ABC-type branched-subunit amino acid transport system substrate-binding protein